VQPREAATTAFDARALRLLARISTYRVPGWDIGQRYGHAANYLNYLARPERFELPTPWFVARYSIQLSYGRTERNCLMNLAGFYVLRMLA